MVRMFARHSVSDFSKWKKVYDGFDAERKGMGVTGHAVFQSVDDPKDVTLWHDFDTIKAAREFAQSERLREVMSEAGVVGKPTVWFVTQA
jgi:hypothetical protein